MRFFIKSLILGSVLFFWGCGGGSSTSSDNNQISTPHAIISLSGTTFLPGQSTRLDGSSSYSDNGASIESYTWYLSNHIISHADSLDYTMPRQEGNYTIKLVVQDSYGHIASSTKSIFVDAFKEIKNLVRSSRDGLIDDLQYICVGDSTRADSSYNGYHIFDDITAQLRQQDYLSSETLLAQPGHRAQWFYDKTQSPTYEDVINAINTPQGKDTIVDISLGINDVRAARSWQELYQDLSKAIDEILSQKPKVHIMLTMPNKLVRDVDDSTGYDTEKNSVLKSVYIQLAQDKKLPLIDTMDLFFNGDVNASMYRAQDARDYGAKVRIHLSEAAQHKIAHYILLRIAP